MMKIKDKILVKRRPVVAVREVETGEMFTVYNPGLLEKHGEKSWPAGYQLLSAWVVAHSAGSVWGHLSHATSEQENRFMESINQK